MDTILKSIHIIIITLVVIAIIYSLIKNLIDKVIANKILKNPCFIEAEIIDVIPGTPTSYGMVNITVHYKFTIENGESFERENELTIIKTMDLPKFNVGATIPVVYSINEPSKNMLNMKRL